MSRVCRLHNLNCNKAGLCIQKWLDQLPKSIQNKRRRVQVKLHKTVFWVLEVGKGHFARLKTETSEYVRTYVQRDGQTDRNFRERTYSGTDRQTDRHNLHREFLFSFRFLLIIIPAEQASLPLLFSWASIEYIIIEAERKPYTPCQLHIVWCNM